MDILDNKFEDLIAKKITDQTEINTKAKGTQDQKDALVAEADKIVVALPIIL